MDVNRSQYTFDPTVTGSAEATDQATARADDARVLYVTYRKREKISWIGYLLFCILFLNRSSSIRHLSVPNLCMVVN